MKRAIKTGCSGYAVSRDKPLNYVLFNHREMFENAVEFRKMAESAR